MESGMPRQSKGARLYLKPAELNKDGKVRKASTWIIRDGSSVVSTGCAPLDREGAEKALEPNPKRVEQFQQVVIQFGCETERRSRWPGPKLPDASMGDADVAIQVI